MPTQTNFTPFETKQILEDGSIARCYELQTCAPPKKLSARLWKKPKDYDEPEKRYDKNLATATVSRLQGSIDIVPLLQGDKQRLEAKQTIWEQFTRAHAHEHWRDLYLILVSKMVRVESDVHEH